MTGLQQSLESRAGLAQSPTSRVLALTYEDGPAFDALLWSVTKDLKARGLRLAGVAQLNKARADRHRCDMLLEELSSGKAVLISHDRGAHARGCRLDLDVLAAVVHDVEHALVQDAEMLIINKFGKEEAEGRGLRNAIAIAVDRRIPVLVGVPLRNRTEWLRFCGDIAVERPATRVAIEAWLNDEISPGLYGEAVPLPV